VLPGASKFSCRLARSQPLRLLRHVCTLAENTINAIHIHLCCVYCDTAPTFRAPRPAVGAMRSVRRAQGSDHPAQLLTCQAQRLKFIDIVIDDPTSSPCSAYCAASHARHAEPPRPAWHTKQWASGGTPHFYPTWRQRAAQLRTAAHARQRHSIGALSA